MKRYKVFFLIALLAVTAAGQSLSSRAERLARQIAVDGRIPASWPDDELVELPEELYQQIIANGRDKPDLRPLLGVESLEWLMTTPEDPALSQLVARGAHRWARLTYESSSFSRLRRKLQGRGFEVRRAYPNLLLEMAGTNASVPNDPMWDRQYYVKQFSAFWQAGVKSLPNVGVVITDTNGSVHPDLVWNEAESKNFIQTGLTPFDRVGHFHGTAVSGVMCAVSNNGIDITGAASCRPILYEVVQTYFVGNEPRGAVSLDAVVKAFIEIAKTTRFTVVNGSWGGFFEMPMLKEVFSATKDHVLWVFAAGNQADNGCHWPAKYAQEHENVLAVTATDQNGDVADFSNRCHGVSNSVAAAGVGVVSTVPGGAATLNGTSLAAPQVAAAAALAGQMLIDAYGVKPADVRPEVIRELLLGHKQAADKRLGELGNPHALDCARVVETIKATFAPPPPPPAPRVVLFEATPETLESGKTTTLKWKVVDATGVSINPLPKATLSAALSADPILPLEGSLVVTPGTTTTFVLTAVGDGGQTTMTVTVTVASSPPPPPPPPPAKPTLVLTTADFLPLGEDRVIPYQEVGIAWLKGLTAWEGLVLKIGGVPCELEFAGPAPGLDGVIQVNFTAPFDVTGQEPVEVVVVVDGNVQSLYLNTGTTTP